MKKKLTMVAALVLVFALGVTGTLAYLTAKTNSITNTFTVGNVKIELKESKSDFKMVPGNTIDKDPKVTVKAASEACWLFVKVVGSNDLVNYIDYSVDTSYWTALDASECPGVYYIDQSAVTADKTYSVLTGDKVKVLDTVDQDAMDKVTDGTATTTLTFTAYAIQKAGFDTAADAWTKLQTTYPATSTSAD